MTPRQRMLSAYRGVLPDTVPVSPEFTSYIPARVMGLDLIEFESVPHWKAMLETFRHYGTEGWSGVGANPPRPDGIRVETKREELPDGAVAVRNFIHTPKGDLTNASQRDRKNPSWMTEHPVKDIDRDWPAYEYWKTAGDTKAIDWKPVNEALAGVGENYLLEVHLPNFFLDFLTIGLEGGLTRMVVDVLDREEFFEGVYERYLEFVKRCTEEACVKTSGESFFLGTRWSCVSLVGPNMWRKWEIPLIRAVAGILHAHGNLLHVHLHGKCMGMIKDLVEAGVDCVCPFERPPGGDVTDLGAVRKILGDRVAMNGNVHTVETLIRGKPADVRREVEEIFEQWGPDKRRLVLGTGDQVGGETAEENIFAFLEAGREFGKCP